MRSSILMLGLVVGEGAAGCGFHSPASAADSGAGSDSGDASNGGCKFATLVDACQLTFDADLMVTANATYDTDTHVLMINGTTKQVAIKTVMIGPDHVDVISAHDVHLAQSVILSATGSHGLAIIANNDFTIEADAQIDVSKGGAGARTSCPSGATKGQDNSGGAAGGGGGGFGADGGHGGDGNNGSSSQGGSQGQAEPSFPTGFHGGCPGADGGRGDAPGGTGGAGGGALYIVAAGRIVLNGSAPLNAGGGGGSGGHGNGNNNGDAGGGGGGSGGLLILEAPHILGSAAVITANGGAGGEGSDSNSSNGASGANATLTTARASGGTGGAVFGSDGGDGGSVLGPAGDSVTAPIAGGGGGGGGGVGFIRVYSPDIQSVTASPASS